MDFIRTIEQKQMSESALNFSVGDTVKVHFEIIEGKTKRIQIFEGIVLCIKNEGVRKTFTVRKTSYGVGVERVFPVYSPRVIKVEIVRPAKVRRSKLYYIRNKVGKAAKVKELIGQQAVDYLNWSRGLSAADEAKEAEIMAQAKAENAAAEAEKASKDKKKK